MYTLLHRPWPQKTSSYATVRVRSLAASSIGSIARPDVLVVGSGGAALTASLRLHSLGLRPLVIEKTQLVGGTTAYSGGGLWIPNSGVPLAEEDSFNEALTYMKATVDEQHGGKPPRASSPERKTAFLEEGPKMVGFLQGKGLVWRASEGLPDYFPCLPGGKIGRSIEAGMFDLKKLPREWRAKMRVPTTSPLLPIRSIDVSKLLRMGSWDGITKVIEVVVWRKLLQGRLLGRDPVTQGISLVGQLLLLNVQRGIPILTSAGLTDLATDSRGNVTGAIVRLEEEDRTVHIAAARGVILAAGGFSRSAALREKHQAPAAAASKTLTAPGDTGEAIAAAVRAGAATELMGEAWWLPIAGDGAANQPIFYERGLPHTIMVDRSGRRFTNEAQSYTRLVHEQLAHNEEVEAVPAYLVLDSQHRSKYMLGGMLPGRGVPRQALESGLVVKAGSLGELANKLGIDEGGLRETVDRFNAMAAKGVDEDFGRGSSPYDTHFGDPRHKPNPNLGSISKAPFYGMRLYPGDLGTKGGVLTDEHARALREDGSVISGLYAAGNSSASVMGKEYIGAGSTLGPALTFAYIAASHIASEPTST